MLKSLLSPSIDEVVSRVAVEYENLDRSITSKLNPQTVSPVKKQGIAARKGIGFHKENEHEVIIYLVLNPYIIKLGEEYYFFDGIPLGRDFLLKNGSIAFKGPPRVLRMKHYNHPFVFSDNGICFGDSETYTRWIMRTDLDIHWMRWYPTTSKCTIKKIAKWLEEGRFVMQEGYFGDWTKVHNLDRHNFPSEYRTARDALSSGVEIYEPSKKS